MFPSQFPRRDFLRHVSAAGCALAAFSELSGSPAARGADAPKADALIPGKDPRLIVHKPNPSELETPADLLWEHEHTPARLIFVRNNQNPDFTLSLAPYEHAADWSLDFAGLVEFPRTIRLADLEQLPRTEVDVVLQCSGNGRKFFSEASPVSGAPWTLGALANVRFGGIPLRAVVDHLKINVDSRAKFLTAEGRDLAPNSANPGKSDAADFEHSVPLADALEFGLLATTLNGEPLPTVHGGPLRLVMPGYYGTMHVKWASRLRFEEQETANHHQVRRYRTPNQPIKPGTKFEYDLANSEPNWRMKIKSQILSPAEGAEIAAGKVAVKGVAFNDGRAKIDRVEISTDGRTWRAADVAEPSGPFGWYRWTAEVDLPAGEQVLRCRAVDALGRTQPLDGQIHWNPAGYAWNGVHQVRLRAT